MQAGGAWQHDMVMSDSCYSIENEMRDSVSVDVQVIQIVVVPNDAQQCNDSVMTDAVAILL